jgi:hypothetical protein
MNDKPLHEKTRTRGVTQMKVRFLPPSPKAGTIEHLEPFRAQPLIDAGFAQFIPPAKRGTNEWLAERAEEEALRIASIPSSASRWSIRESTSNDPRVRFVVAKTSPLGETTFYDAPPADAPLKIKQQFADAIATDAAAFSSRAEFLKRQNAHREPSEQSRATDIAVVTFGVNGVKK